MAGVKRRLSTGPDIRAFHKELDEVSCPICMDHPHNAVLLLCSSHEKGCRSYICDTSYRHSNCLDRFRKLRASSSASLQSSSPSNTHNLSTSEPFWAVRTNTSEEGNNNLNENNAVATVRLTEARGHNSLEDSSRHLEPQGMLEAGESESQREMSEQEELGVETSESKIHLKCPLCRGTVLGWEIVEEVRKYLNMKKRSCSRESCSFSGNYQELRRHARRIHPATRPSDVDPSRERAWRRLEHQREYGDIVSAIRSAMPGAVVVGDYVIENGDRSSLERETATGQVSGPWWTTFFLFQMIGSLDAASESRARTRAWMRHRRSVGSLSERRFLWGENLLGLQEADDEDDDPHVLSDLGEDASPIPRRRRRLTRSRSDEEDRR